MMTEYSMQIDHFEIVTIPALEVFENYYFLLHDSLTQKTVAIDCGDAQPILNALQKKNWTLDEIWLTHHHWDHIDGVADLKAATGAKIVACTQKSPKMPTPDIELPLEGQMDFANHTVQIMHLPGHADGHIGFYIEAANALFCGDVIMPMGCGRLSEGTAEEMLGSIQKIIRLPKDTVLFSGHEYAAGNIGFTLTIEPDNPKILARAHDMQEKIKAKLPTVPSTLNEEIATNLFLRYNDQSVKNILKAPEASSLDIFTTLRAQKDKF